MSNQVLPSPISSGNQQSSASRENVETTRHAVRDLLKRSDAFNALDQDKRRKLANDLVQVGSYLAEPDGVRVAPSQQSAPVIAMAEQGVKNRRNTQEGDGNFDAQGAREGAAVAGALLEAVNFPEFVSGLIDGVFHSIVTSSIEQMEAYAKLVADVSKSLNQFRDDNTTQNQGRDHLIDTYPDMFELTVDTGDFGSDFGNFDDEETPAPGPRVTLRSDIDERAAVDRLNQELPLEQPLTRLDDRLVEAVLVPAARTQLATGRQQLLATTIMMGINRIVVTDGRIAAKVMYDFKARDNMKFRQSAQQFDYGDKNITTRSGNFESEGSSSRQGTSFQGGSRSADGSTQGGSFQGGRRDSSFYSKGDYKNTSQPVLKLASASQSSIDASLETKASLSGMIEVNFKSDYLPLEKLANPEAIAAIQMNAQPGMVKNLANRPAPSSEQTP